MSKAQKALTALKGAASGARRVAAAIHRSMPTEAVKGAVARYESFTGVHELRELHKAVIHSQEKFVAAQEGRRAAGDKLNEQQLRLRAIREEMQTISKGDPGYLRLITEEHKLIVEEESLRNEFAVIEKLEREHFTEMTAAVKHSHETERFYAEKNKYLYIVASIVGTTLGIVGSNVNNRIKMAEFKEMMIEEKSGSKIWNLSFSDGPIQAKLGDLESRIVAISTNQRTILDYLVQMEKRISADFSTVQKLVDKKKTSIFSTPVIKTPNGSISSEQTLAYTFYAAAGTLALVFVYKLIS